VQQVTFSVSAGTPSHVSSARFACIVADMQYGNLVMHVAY